MNMLPKSPVTQLHEEIHIKDEPIIKNEFESSTEASNFSTHLESNKIKDLFCEQCQLQFDKKIVYDIHLKIVHKKDTIKLEDGRNDIPVETRCKPVNDTSTVHEENRQHTCILCGYVPKTKYKPRELENHLARVHFKDKIDKVIPKCKPYKCPEIDCFYVGKDNQSILRHFTGKHDILRKWLKEALSTKEIVNSSDSIPNINTMITEPLPKFKCIFCNTAFSNDFSLKKHYEEFHWGKKLHKCLTCDYNTSFKRNLVNHIKTVHEGKKPHKCWICDYSCDRKSHLKKHVSTVHEGKKRYYVTTCELCGYVPTTKNKWREKQDHLARVHFKDKIDKIVPKCRPYKCPKSDCLYVGKDNQSVHCCRSY